MKGKIDVYCKSDILTSSDWFDLEDSDFEEIPILTTIENARIGEILEIKNKRYVCCIGHFDGHGEFNRILVKPINLENEEDVEDQLDSDWICPVCGYLDRDSFELSDSDDAHDCGGCGATVSYERIVTVEYSVSLVKYPEITVVDSEVSE